MNIVDFHTHIYPDKISQKAVKSVGDFYNIPMDGDGTAQALLSDGASCGITGYVVQSGNCAASYQVDNKGKTYICVTADAHSSWRCIYDHVDIYQKYTG